MKRAKIASQTLSVKNTFNAIAEEWLEKKASKVSANQLSKTKGRINNYVPPQIKKQPIEAITTKEIADFIYPIAEKGQIDTAKRVLNIVSQIYRYAMVFGYANDDKTLCIVDYLPTATTTHYASIKDPKKLGAILRSIDSYQGHYATKQALRILPHVFVRSSELRGARWSEIDFDSATWEIPANRMKSKRPHIVPLSTQTMAILEEVHEFTGNSDLIFPSPISNLKQLSENALNQALRRLGYSKEEVTSHGFRSTASTLLREKLEQPNEWIEAQLAHSVKDKTEAAYNHAQYLQQRRGMMQQWSDYLGEL